MAKTLSKGYLVNPNCDGNVEVWVADLRKGSAACIVEKSQSDGTSITQCVVQEVIRKSVLGFQGYAIECDRLYNESEGLTAEYILNDEFYTVMLEKTSEKESIDFVNYAEVYKC